MHSKFLESEIPVLKMEKKKIVLLRSRNKKARISNKRRKNLPSKTTHEMTTKAKSLCPEMMRA